MCHFPIGILSQVWHLIVSIPDLCTLTYFEGRVNSAAHRINNTLGKSLEDKISYVTGRQLSPQTTNALDDITRDYERHKQDTITSSFKRNRVRKRARNEADYYLYRIIWSRTTQNGNLTMSIIMRQQVEKLLRRESNLNFRFA